MQAEAGLAKRIDWLLVITYLVLVIMGWMNIYSTEFSEVKNLTLNFTRNFEKQLIWIAVSLVVAASILIIDSKFYISFAYIIYGLCIILLVVVLFVGQEISGSRSWIVMGSYKAQPAEFAKFATVLAMAKYMSTRYFSLKNLNQLIISILIVALPMVLIAFQKETGSALVFLAFVLVLYREGLSIWVPVTGICIVALFLLALILNQFILMGIIFAFGMATVWYFRKNKGRIYRIVFVVLLSAIYVIGVDYGFNNILKPHQQERINVLLGRDVDLSGAAYNINQSQIAIGSGGLFGKGYLKGTQTKYNFIPEQSTDFIFCTIGEEWGFAGSCVVIGLFLYLLIRIINFSERQRSSFSRIFGYGAASILFFHLAVNVGMTIGLAPVIGIPFPFFSYGGSNLLSFTILVFIFIKLDAERKMSLNRT